MNQYSIPISPIGASAYAEDVSPEPEELEYEIASVLPVMREEDIADLNSPRPYPAPTRRPQSIIGKYIRDKRNEIHISQMRLAARCGLKQSHVSMIETGNSHPRRSSADKIADALRVPRGEFWEIVRQSKEESTRRIVDDGSALVQIGLYIPYRIKRWYQDHAHQKGFTMSRMMADAIRNDYLQKTGNKS